MKLDPNRRQFLKNATRTAAGVCGAGIILGLQQQQAKAKEGVALRPPGALPESDFLAACSRCGQCIWLLCFHQWKPAGRILLRVINRVKCVWIFHV